MTLLHRRPSIQKEIEGVIQQAVDQVIETTNRNPISPPPLNTSLVLSTGSTLLDLAISGGRIKGGGIPPGILVEIFGPSGCGKTALLAEIGASCQAQGGVIRFLDPEARLDQEYTKIYGLSLTESGNEYYRPDTVVELIDHIITFKVPEDSPIGVVAADSIAALSTDIEMEKGDKMGMKRAKDFSEGLRKVCRLISQDNRLVIFTNQIRESMAEGGFGPKETTPGGKALPFYSSLRLRVGPGYPNPKIKKEIVQGKLKLTKVVGIHSTVDVVKSSIDEPYREAPIYIIFGYGIDDIRANLEYVKKMTGANRFKLGDSHFQSMNESVQFCEENQLQERLREEVVKIWEGIESQMRVSRVPKIRR